VAQMRVSVARASLSVFFVVVLCYTAIVYYCVNVKQNLDSRLAASELSAIRLAELVNAHAGRRNVDKYPSLALGYIPIVIYVNERARYFSQVVAALRRVSRISETVLVVSHDRVDKDMLDIVDSIDFCQVQQVFHPTAPTHSSSVSALKDHWMWLQEHVWTQAFPSHQGDIVFLEEDHVVAPDTYEVMLRLASLKHRGIVSNCGAFAVGAYQIDWIDNPQSFVAFQGFSNTGYGFNRTVWDYFRKNWNVFQDRCQNSDDWDECAAMLMLASPQPSMVSPRVTRVVNVGRKGLHLTQTEADAKAKGEHRGLDSVTNNGSVVLHLRNSDGPPVCEGACACFGECGEPTSSLPP